MYEVLSKRGTLDTRQCWRQPIKLSTEIGNFIYQSNLILVDLQPVSPQGS